MGLKNVIAYAGWCPQVALVAIVRGWFGDYWVVRETPNEEWAFRGAYVNAEQKGMLRDVYAHARNAIELRERCTEWCRNHPGWEDGDIPHDIVIALRSSEEEQGIADDILEDVIYDHPDIAEYAKSHPAVRRM